MLKNGDNKDVSIYLLGYRPSHVISIYNAMQSFVYFRVHTLASTYTPTHTYLHTHLYTPIYLPSRVIMCCYRIITGNCDHVCRSFTKCDVFQSGFYIIF